MSVTQLAVVDELRHVGDGRGPEKRGFVENERPDAARGDFVRAHAEEVRGAAAAGPFTGLQQQAFRWTIAGQQRIEDFRKRAGPRPRFTEQRVHGAARLGRQPLRFRPEKVRLPQPFGADHVRGLPATADLIEKEPRAIVPGEREQWGRAVGGCRHSESWLG